MPCARTAAWRRRGPRRAHRDVPSAADAVACAIDLARGGAERVGLDAGENDFDATLVADPLWPRRRVAGQVLVSETVRLLAGQGSPAPMRAAGALRLRGVGQPVGTAEVLHGDVPPAGPPPARGADHRRHRRRPGAPARGFRVILEAEPDIDGRRRGRRRARGGRRGPAPAPRRRAHGHPHARARRHRGDAADPRRRGPRPRCSILTTFDLDEYVYDALRAGASGFLLKDAPAARALDAIRAVAAGDALLAPSITRRLIEQFARLRRPRAGGRRRRSPTLTARELEVLRLLARGLSNAEIAAELVLGEQTVKTHVGRMLAKLGLRDRVQAVVLAYETGLAGR